MNVVDSSAWLEYFGKGPNAAVFAPVIRDTKSLVVPVITLYEVFKRIRLQVGEDAAFEGVGYMLHGKVIELDMMLSLSAALLSRQHKLPMADSIILATAYAYDAEVWTQDADFDGIEGVRYFAKPTS